MPLKLQSWGIFLVTQLLQIPKSQQIHLRDPALPLNNAYIEATPSFLNIDRNLVDTIMDLSALTIQIDSSHLKLKVTRKTLSWLHLS